MRLRGAAPLWAAGRTSVMTSEQAVDWADDVSRVTDRELVAGLRRLVRTDQMLNAQLLVHLGEADARRLYREHAYPLRWRTCGWFAGRKRPVRGAGFWEDMDASQTKASARVFAKLGPEPVSSRSRRSGHAT